MPTHNETPKLERLNTLIQRIWNAEESDFYRNVWGAKPADVTSLEALQELPVCTPKHLMACPLRERLYTEERGLYTKLLYLGDPPTLFARTFGDIGQDHFGIDTGRPLLMFSIESETIEKSLWQYEHNRLALLRTPNPKTTAMLAAQYEIDSIVADTEALKEDLPALVQAYDRERITDIAIIDNKFDTAFLYKQFPQSTQNLILALPETGAIGAAMQLHGDATPRFSVDEHTVVEIDASSKLIVSRLLELPTPIIRYQTDITASWEDEDRTSFTLHT